MGPQNTSTCFQKQNLLCKKTSRQEYLRYPIQYVATVTNHWSQSLNLYLQLVTYWKAVCLWGLIYVALLSTVWIQHRNETEKKPWKLDLQETMGKSYSKNYSKVTVNAIVLARFSSTWAKSSAMTARNKFITQFFTICCHYPVFEDYCYLLVISWKHLKSRF